MTLLERLILEGIAKAEAAIDALPKGPGNGLGYIEWGELNMRRHDFKRFGIHLDFPTWTSHPATGTHRQRCRRALASLAAAGLVKLVASWGERVTHVKLTRAGREALAALEPAGREAIGDA